MTVRVRAYVAAALRDLTQSGGFTPADPRPPPSPDPSLGLRGGIEEDGGPYHAASLCDRDHGLHLTTSTAGTTLSRGGGQPL